MKLTKSRLKQLVNEVINEKVIVPDNIDLKGSQGKDGYWVYTAEKSGFSGTGKHPIEGTAKEMAMKNLRKAMRAAIEKLKKGKKKQKLDENMSLRIIRNGKDVTARRQFQPGDDIIATFTLTGYKPTTGRSKVGKGGIGLAAKAAKFQALDRMDDQIFGRTPKSDAAKAKEAPKEQAAIKKERAAAVAPQKTAPPAPKKPAAKLSNVERYRKDIKNYLRSFDIAVKEKNQAVIDNLTKDNPLMGMGTRELLDTLKKNTSEYDRDRGIRKLKRSLSRRGKDFKSRGKMVDFLLSLPIKHPARLAFRKAYANQRKR